MWKKPKLQIGQAFYMESWKPKEQIERVFKLCFVHRLYRTEVSKEKFVELVDEKGEIIFNWPIYKLEAERAPKFDRPKSNLNPKPLYR